MRLRRVSGGRAARNGGGVAWRTTSVLLPMHTACSFGRRAGEDAEAQSRNPSAGRGCLQVVVRTGHGAATCSGYRKLWVSVSAWGGVRGQEARDTHVGGGQEDWG